MTHPYSEWCICDQCASVALMFLPDCQPYERRYLTPEKIATWTGLPLRLLGSRSYLNADYRRRQRNRVKRRRH